MSASLDVVLLYDKQRDLSLSEQRREEGLFLFNQNVGIISHLAQPVLAHLSDKQTICRTVMAGDLCFNRSCPYAHTWVMYYAISNMYKGTQHAKSVSSELPLIRIEPTQFSSHSNRALNTPPLHTGLTFYDQSLIEARLPVYSEKTKGQNLDPSVTFLLASPDSWNAGSPKDSIDDTALDLLMDSIDEITQVHEDCI